MVRDCVVPWNSGQSHVPVKPSAEWQVTDLLSPWPAVGVVRLAGETTLSFLNRLAARYNVTVTGLLSAVGGFGVRRVTGKRAGLHRGGA